MAKVIIDPHMFSESWFNDHTLKLLIECKNVDFVYSQANVALTEMSKVRKAIQFYKLMGDQKKLVLLTSDDHDKCLDFLKNCVEWCDCNACDDPHIFAMVRHNPKSFVFSKDRRLATCRDKVRKVVPKEFTQFSLIMTKEIFEMNSPKIMK